MFRTRPSGSPPGREFVKAIKTDNNSERGSQARIGFQKFTSDEKQGDVKPDIIALIDASGNVLAMHDVATVVPKQWRNDKPVDDKLKAVMTPTVLPALNVVLGKRVIISDIWSQGDKGMMKIGVAPIIDPDAPVSAKDPEGVVIIGAIVVAYSQTAKEAQKDRLLLGTEIAYYDGNRVVATSFMRGATTEEDTAKAKRAREAGRRQDDRRGRGQEARDDRRRRRTSPRRCACRGRRPSRCPPRYPPITAGAVVLAPLSAQRTRRTPPAP